MLRVIASYDKVEGKLGEFEEMVSSGLTELVEVQQKCLAPKLLEGLPNLRPFKLIRIQSKSEARAILGPNGRRDVRA